MRVALEKEAKSAGSPFYGQGKEDDLQDPVLYAPSLRLVKMQHTRYPWSWSRLLSYSANDAIFCEPSELRGNLLRLAAVTVAWIEDIDRREHTGKKKVD